MNEVNKKCLEEVNVILEQQDALPLFVVYMTEKIENTNRIHSLHFLPMKTNKGLLHNYGSEVRKAVEDWFDKKGIKKGLVNNFVEIVEHE